MMRGQDPARGAGGAWAKAGGLAALLLAAGYVATMPLFAMVGVPPEGTLARLEYHQTGTAAWWAIVALSVATDLLFVPLAIALYSALRASSEAGMRFSVAFILLFVVLDLAVLWPAKASLISLGAAYATASADARVGLLGAAGYPSAVLESGLVPVYSVLTLAVGIVGTATVMLRAGVGRPTALVGVATGVLGIGSVVETLATGAFPVLVVLTSLLTIVWLVLAGIDLLRGRLSLSVGRP